MKKIKQRLWFFGTCSIAIFSTPTKVNGNYNWHLYLDSPFFDFELNFKSKKYEV